MEKMTAAQKNAYLEAHMAVQQHMAQAAMQLKHQHNSINHRASGSGGGSAATTNGSSSNQSPSNVTSSQQYGNNTIKVPQISSSSSGGADSTFTVPDDGMGFEGGVRVLQSLGNW